MKRQERVYMAAAAVFAFLYAYLQLSLMPQLRSCILEKAGVNFSTTAIKSCTSQPLILMAGLLGALALALLAAGAKNGYFGRFYAWLEQKRKEWLILAGLAGLFALPYLSRGNVVLGDAMQYSALSIYVKESLLQAAYPYWTFSWYMGSAPLTFYGWLSMLATGIVNLFVSIDWANKILFFAFHVGSALLAYKFVKVATGNTKAAIVAGLLYGLSFEHIARIMVGRSVTALTYLLTPLLFLVYELRISGKIGKYRFVAAAAAVISLLAFNHQADAIFIVAVFAAYTVLKTLEGAREKTKTTAAELVFAFALVAAITSFWMAPMLLERGEASATGKAIEIFMPSLPHADAVSDLLGWPGKFGDKPFFYIGISLLILASMGMAYLMKNKKKAVAVVTIAAFVLLLFQSSRYMPATLLLLGLCAGYGFIQLGKRTSVDSTKLLFAVAAVIILDMVPATVQLGYPDFSYNKQFYDTLHANDGERILDLSTDRRTFWPSYVYINNKGETVFGTLIESAPRSLAYSAAIAQKAAVEYYDKKQSFSQETRQALYLLGVKYAVVHSEQIGKKPREVFAAKRGALGLERGLEIVELEHSPIIASRQKKNSNIARPLESVEGWKIRAAFEERSIPTDEVSEIIGEMGIDTKKAVAAKILTKEGNSESVAPEEGELNLKVTEAATTADKATISYEINAEAFLQLSYSHNPHLSVKIDGTETAYWKTAINTIAVKTTAGKHTITIEGKQSAARKGLFGVSAAAIVLLIFLFMKK